MGSPPLRSPAVPDRERRVGGHGRRSGRIGRGAQTPAPAPRRPSQGHAGLRPAVAVRQHRAQGARRGQRDHRHGVDDAAAGPGRDHHAIGPALPDGPRQRHSGHRSEAASAADARHGRPAPHLHDGRTEALPVRLEGLLPRMQRQQPSAARSQRRFRAAGARAHQLQRVDGRVAVGAAQGVRRAERRELDRRRRDRTRTSTR